MKTHQIFSKVGGIIAEINEQYQYLLKSPESLNDLELELLSANADFLAEHVKVLRKLNAAQVVQQEAADVSPADDIYESSEYKASTQSTPDTIPLTEHLIKQEFPESYADLHKEMHHEVPAPYHFASENENIAVPEVDEESQAALADKSAPLEEIQASEKPSNDSFFTPEARPQQGNEEPNRPSPAVGKSVSSEVVIEEKVVTVAAGKAEEPTTKIPTVNELMSAKLAQSPTTNTINTPQVTDLKSIINLNDKLLFIKDLFNGYSLAYSEAIELINRFDSFDAADNFLKGNYAEKNNWASKQATVDKFYGILNKRFSS
jgi:hypothetical protein